MPTAIQEPAQDGGICEATGTIQIVSFRLADETFQEPKHIAKEKMLDSTMQTVS